jgi:ceramide glucosyltransferase
LRAIYQRQTRWARLRRASFPEMYAPEILVGSVIPMLAGAYAARDFGFEPWTAAALVALAFAIPETLANLALRWPSTWLSPLALIVRDWVFAVIWIDGWLGDDFVWLGNSMTVREASDEPADRAA